MIEPPKLRDETDSDLERALLDAGSSYKGSASTRAKTLAALGLAGSATLLSGAAAATSLTSAAKLTWVKVLLGVSLVGAAAAVPVGYQMWQGRQAKQEKAVATVAAPAVAPQRLAALPESLTRELAALDDARAALVRGDARGALVRLDTYAQSFPNGRLELEAEVLRIDALARSGRLDAARSRADAFLRRYPNSVLAARVRAHATLNE
jgi:hypothetical protein